MNRSEELDLMRQELEQLKAEKLMREQRSFRNQMKSSLRRMALNTVNDLPSTVPGLAVSSAIIVGSWPNPDMTAIAEALGFGVFGAMSNTRGGYSDNDFHHNDFNELG